MTGYRHGPGISGKSRGMIHAGFVTASRKPEYAAKKEGKVSSPPPFALGRWETFPQPPNGFATPMFGSRWDFRGPIPGGRISP